MGRAFAAETGFPEGPEELVRSVDARLGAEPGIARVGPVYTPPEHRRRGYATMLVAAWTRRLLDGGIRTCALFTDLANPTSNSIYQAVGYRPAGDARIIDFA